MQIPKIIRRAGPEDITAIVALLRRVYPSILASTQAMIAAQIANFPEGILVASSGDQIVGYAANIRLAEAVAGGAYSWKELTGFGTGSTHDETGDVLYGIELAVDPACASQGIANALLQARIDCAREFGLNAVYIASRLPGLRAYHAHHPTVTGEVYVRHVLAGLTHDHTACLGLRLGFAPLRVIEKYIPLDTESMGCALLKCRSMRGETEAS